MWIQVTLHYQLDYDNDILYEDMTGTISEKEAHRAISNHINYNNSHKGMKILTNLNDAKLKLSNSCIIELAKKCNEHYNNFRGTKWAFLVYTDKNFAMAKMFASYTETHSFLIKVFRSKNIAEAWLNS